MVEGFGGGARRARRVGRSRRRMEETKGERFDHGWSGQGRMKDSEKGKCRGLTWNPNHKERSQLVSQPASPARAVAGDFCLGRSLVWVA